MSSTFSNTYHLTKTHAFWATSIVQGTGGSGPYFSAKSLRATATFRAFVSLLLPDQKASWSV